MNAELRAHWKATALIRAFLAGCVAGLRRERHARFFPCKRCAALRDARPPKPGRSG